MRRPWRTAMLVMLAFFISGWANALTITPYTDEAAFRQAAGRPLVTEDFEAFQQLLVIPANSTQVINDDFSIQDNLFWPPDSSSTETYLQNGALYSKEYWFDVSPLELVARTDFLFNYPILHFGGQFHLDPSDATNIGLWVRFYNDGSPLQTWNQYWTQPITIPADASGFYGWISDQPFDEVRIFVPIDIPFQQVWSVDYVVYTPEPATILLFAAGLGGVGLVTWRRRRERDPPDEHARAPP